MINHKHQAIMEKNICLFILGMILSLNANAQYSKDHIKFMGIPLGCKVDLFVSQLSTKGFDIITDWGTGTSMKSIMLEGKFMGEVKTIHVGYNGYRIAKDVSINYEAYSWKSAYDKYLKLKSMLTQKYGKPKKAIESFPSQANQSDKSKVIAIKNGTGKCESVFQVNSGEIELEIKNSDNLLVWLTYKDLTVKERRPIDDL